jgi:hypothetical protein
MNEPNGALWETERNESKAACNRLLATYIYRQRSARIYGVAKKIAWTT